MSGTPFVNLSIILVPILGENESGWLPDDALNAGYFSPLEKVGAE